MLPILTSKQIRSADVFTIKHEPISSIDLMERAASCCYKIIRELLKSHQQNCKIHIFCGVGNNGGDGLAISRMLINDGYSPAIYKVCFSQKSSDNFQKNAIRLKEIETKIQSIKSENDFPRISADDIIILDDGFQNLYLNCDLKILVIDENYLFGNELVLPAGPLRDTVAWHIEEADCIFFIRSSDLQIDDKIMKYISSKPVFYLKPQLISEIDLSKNYLVFSALANNAKFSTFLLANNVKVAEIINYRDHHQYNNKDYQHIIDKAMAKGLSILTTEKDAVKIDNKQLQDYIICQMRLEFIDQQDFVNFIKKKLK